MLAEMLKEKMEKVKPEKMGEMDKPAKEYFPSFCLNSKTLPEIKDWEVGEEYYLVLKVEQKSKNMHADDKDEKWHADFDIKEIGVLDKEDQVDEEDASDDKMLDKKELKKKYLK
jgi:hypothetical protein